MIADILIADHKRIARTTHLDSAAVGLMRDTFAEVGAAQTRVAPVAQIFVPEVGGQVCLKGATSSRHPLFAVKASANFPANARSGLPTNDGFMVLFDAATGLLRAVLLDHGYLTRLRTAAAGAAATHLLARADARKVTVVGAGNQAELQILALRCTREIDHVVVCARDASRAAELAAKFRQRGLDASSTSDLEQAVRAAEILITTTSARHPIISAEWVAPGAHITAVGSDAPDKTELASDLLPKAEPYACDHLEQCRTLGEWRAALENGVLLASPPPTLGDIVSGARAGRTRDEAITIADLTGVGIQDTVIAIHAYRNLLRDMEDGSMRQ